VKKLIFTPYFMFLAFFSRKNANLSKILFKFAP